MAFSEFRGNPQIVTALRGALRSGRVPHALLFTGPHGLGKFTLARLFAQAANCERLTDDACGECYSCQRVALLSEPQRLIEQGLIERGESADAATVERVPLILQSHPDVWALVPDPVRLKTPVARPMLRIGQLRAVQRAAYFEPMGRRRAFIIDGAETMRWDVANVFLKILEEPPGSATLILTAPSPYSLLPTIVSRCLQFHFAPLPAAEVEAILKEKSDLSPAAIRAAAQLAEGSPGYALEMDVEKESQRRREALKILDRASRGEEFGQIFAQTGALAKDRTTSFEDQLSVFYSLLSDLLELSSGIHKPQIRNQPLRKELEVLARRFNVDSILRALRGLDQLAAGARRNLNKQLGLEAFAADLAG
ncbi:MAG TPA: DNA polymerase III subunit delta' C-terminal domain-containing protein [Candidatus Eisenbacteria bacterium]|jgi:DNA polymerase-3 subunit delta'|nr:DNA polymerase III subunit delta' C-terminal domain-containing protein [Candidatus Eisenbacteria bacterium]